MKSVFPINEESIPPHSFARTFAAFRHRNYRLWFYGQLTSLFGGWMQLTAQGYLAFELTQSSQILGYIVFASGIPAWILMLYGGVVVDRVSKRKLLLMTQLAMMAFALVLSALTFFGVVQAWHIVVLAFLLGIANAFDAPARQAFVIELVSREDLTNAIALNSTMFNLATAMGPAVGGIIYAWFGPGWCFLVNALSFLAIIGALLAMRLNDNADSRRHAKKGDFTEGILYVARHSLVRSLLLIVVVVTTFGLSFTTLIPAWGVKVLGGKAMLVGLLYSARGIGSMLGALAVAALVFSHRGAVIAYGLVAMPITLFLFGIVHWIPASLVMMAAFGAAFIIVLNLINALIQTTVPDSLRGRVMGFYGLTFFGFMPVGGLLVGMLGDRIGEASTVLICGVVLGIAAMVTWISIPQLRSEQ